MGSPEKVPTDEERENRSVIRKSLHAAERVESGESLTRENVAVTRPADGVAPRHYEAVVGGRARETLDPGEAITADAVDVEVDAEGDPEMETRADGPPASETAESGGERSE
ncbi:SAF domain-containing protein [Halorussus caseinilyticus]|uniref:SAF domain-containing protein n=2 Tax=Halorussus caseinilyticus TaxID=3034025 RepID=A0ABD5WI00_9EURY